MHLPCHMLAEFKSKWVRSEEHWNDQRRKEFSKEHIQELEMIIKNATDSMVELSNILGTVIQKCK